MKYVLNLIAFSCLALAACSSSAPDGEFVKDELNKHYKQMASLGMGAMAIKADSVKVKGCKRDNSNPKLSHCDVYVVGRAGGKDVDGTKAMPLSFLKAGDGWTIAE